MVAGSRESEYTYMPARRVVVVVLRVVHFRQLVQNFKVPIGASIGTGLLSRNRLGVVPSPLPPAPHM